MYVRRCPRTKAAKEHVYWQVVESYRTASGPRQRVVAYLGDLEEADREGIAAVASGKAGLSQANLLAECAAPEWVEVDLARLRVERTRDFGGYWLAQLPQFEGHTSFRVGLE